MEDKKIQWHPAFFGTLHVEPIYEKQEFNIGEEYVLNTMPLKIDAVIIKKRKEYVPINEMAKIFRKHNLFEFKSPNAALNYDVFIKGIAYAYLYKVQDRHAEKIELSDISLTFIRGRRPVGLFKKLERENFTIEEIFPGIYYVNGYNKIPIQIIVTNELDREKHIWLYALSERLDEECIRLLLKKTSELTDSDDRYYADSVWEIVTRQNIELIKRMKEDDEVCKAMAELFKPEMESAFNNGFNNGFEDGIDSKGMQVFKNMIKRGFSIEEAQALAEISDELVNKALESN